MNHDNVSHLYAEVNFLPASYALAEQRRRIVQRQLVLSVLVVAGLMAMVMQTWSNHRHLALYHQSLAEQAATMQKQVTEATKLQQARAELSRQLEVQRQLHQPISYSQITGTLAALTPDTISLRLLQVSTEKTVIKPATPKPGKRGAKVAEQKPEVRYAVQLEVEGYAPSDDDIATMLARLNTSGVFEQIKMLYSKQSERRGVTVRQFMVRMQVPLDREYQAAGEVADAH